MPARPGHLAVRAAARPVPAARGAAGRPRPTVAAPAPTSPPARKPPAPPPLAPTVSLSSPARAASIATAEVAVMKAKALAGELAAAKARIADLERELAAACPPPPPPPPTTTTILYKTGWASAFAHLSSDGGPWTAAPGLALPPPGQDDGPWRALVVPSAGKVEVVFTDGDGAWDTPDPTAPKGVNYTMRGGGVWTVRRGAAARVAVPEERAADPGAGGWGWVP